VKRTALVVDDDPLGLEVTRERLIRAGFEVVVHEGALGTSTVLTREAPDVFLDITMPAISCEALAKQIAENRKFWHVAMILHSAKNPDELQADAEQCDALGAIPKTSEESVFRHQLERLLLGRRLASSSEGVRGPRRDPG
jgi:CheY-like chemotaxis protein